MEGRTLVVEPLAALGSRRPKHAPTLAVKIKITDVRDEVAAQQGATRP